MITINSSFYLFVFREKSSFNESNTCKVCYSHREADGSTFKQRTHETCTSIPVFFISDVTSPTTKISISTSQSSTSQSSTSKSSTSKSSTSKPGDETSKHYNAYQSTGKHDDNGMSRSISVTLVSINQNYTPLTS